MSALKEPPEMVILDRDGVVLQHVQPYILTMGDVSFVKGSDLAIRAAAAAGVHLAVVTNQSPIGRGLVTESFVDSVDRWIRDQVGLCERVLPTYRCPHTNEDRCACRKPAPGLLTEAMHRAGADPRRTWMVGDHDTDMRAALAAGIPTRLHVLSGRQTAPSPWATAEFADLAGALPADWFSQEKATQES